MVSVSFVASEAVSRSHVAVSCSLSISGNGMRLL